MGSCRQLRTAVLPRSRRYRRAETSGGASRDEVTASSCRHVAVVLVVFLPDLPCRRIKPTISKPPLARKAATAGVANLSCSITSQRSPLLQLPSRCAGTRRCLPPSLVPRRRHQWRHGGEVVPAAALGHSMVEWRRRRR